jgi:hypothetical protein
VSQLSPGQVFVLSEDANLDIKSNFKGNTAELNFVKATEAKYYLRVKANGPIILVFLSTFDRNWKLYYKPESNKWEGLFPETWYLNPIDERYHFRVNGYGNAWWVDLTTGEHKMIMEYKPQNQYYLAYYVATASKLLGIVVLLICWIDSARKRASISGG